MQARATPLLATGSMVARRPANRGVRDMESCGQDNRLTKNPATITVTPDADPKAKGKNTWILGLGADPVPAGLSHEGYGAEVRWDVNKLGLISGHQYRLYFMVHDGDQNKTGGDVGQACGYFTMP